MSEIAGIIRNGIERGWPTDEIKNSLLNSGYPTQEIDYELSQLLNRAQGQSTSAIQSTIIKPTISTPVHLPIQGTQQNKFNSQDLSNYQTPSVEKKASNWMVIAITVLLVLCVLTGAGLFLFG